MQNGKRKDLYHHCDGYYEGVGEDLAQLLEAYDSRNKKSFFNLLMIRRGKDGGYEETGVLHGDIEYYYVLDFDKGEFTGYEVDGFPAWNYDAKFEDINVMPAQIKSKMDLLTRKKTEISSKSKEPDDILTEEEWHTFWGSLEVLEEIADRLDHTCNIDIAIDAAAIKGVVVRLTDIGNKLLREKFIKTGGEKRACLSIKENG